MIRKQLNFDIEPKIHTRLRDEAARQGKPLVALVLQWLKPFFDRLPPAQHEREENAVE